jgi:aspartyl-tRNA(Asn)/glutamyl-tRNA(Gln) amidotransferase subunit A
MEASGKIRSRAISPLELTRICLERSHRLQPSLNAFITVCDKSALEQARQAEREILRGAWRGPLHGIPVALKDNIDTAGIRTTAASAVFEARVPSADAAVVERLRAAGAVILGKLNMYEFAASPESYWGDVHNPWSADTEAGPSSSGAGAAVASGCCFAALGTDTGGSVRIPASFCGVVGLKPTFGRVSTRGVVTGSTSLEHLGPLCRSIGDARVVLEAIAGYDPASENSLPLPWAKTRGEETQFQSQPTFALVGSSISSGLDPEVELVVAAALASLEAYAARHEKVVEVPRYMDVIQGLVAEDLALHAPLMKTSSRLYQPRLRANLQAALARGADGVGYVNTRRTLWELRQGADNLFPAGVDVLAMPTWKYTPMTLEGRRALRDTAAARYFMHDLWNTQPFNVLGLPALSIQCGFTAAGLPVGLQLVGRWGADLALLDFAEQYERRHRWRARWPAL